MGVGVGVWAEWSGVGVSGSEGGPDDSMVAPFFAHNQKFETLPFQWKY